MNLRFFGAIGLCALLAGCASSAEEVRASYVSPLTYQPYTCQQLGLEAERVSARVAQLSGAQNENATNDAIATGVAIVVFWPAAFLLEGDGQTAAELGRLKGEFETIEKVAIQKNCGFEFRKTQAGAPT